MKKEFVVQAIEEGTVVDHIPSNMTLKVAKILDVHGVDGIISIATNLPSKSLGKKGLIKIGGKELTPNEVDKIALLAPNATASIIKNFEVKEKHKITLPKTIENVAKCSNPNCITNNEEVDTKFYVLKEKPLKIRCHYCERDMGQADIALL